MSLNICSEQNSSRKEDTAKLVGEYLKGAVHEMRKMDFAARYMETAPSRFAEKAAALDYMIKKPLAVKDKTVAMHVIDNAKHYYEAEAAKAPLRAKMEYVMGNDGMKKLRNTVLCGAAVAIGGALAANGVRPEHVGLGLGAAAAVIGGTYMAVGAVKESGSKKYAEKLDKYTEAKEALYVLKMMKKQLKAQKRAETKAAVLTVLNLKGATR